MLLLFFGYVSAAFLSVYFGRYDGGTAFWAANGVIVAALLCLPLSKSGPLVALCALVNLGLNLSDHLSPERSLLYTGMNLTLSVCVAALARSYCGAATDLSRALRMARFVGITALCVAVEATVGALIVRHGFTTGFPVTVVRWFIGDFLGIVLLAPATIMLMKRGRAGFVGKAGLRERTALLLMLGGLTWIAFSHQGSPAFILIYPLILLASFRLGPTWVYAGVYLVAVIATALTVRGHGPLPGLHLGLQVGESGQLIQMLQLFLFSVFLSALPTTMALAEERRTRAQLARRERVAQQAKVRAELATLAKSDFLALMSHEIRTPLNGILGFGRLLASGEGRPRDRRRYAEIVVSSGDLLRRLLDDILDFSRIAAGGLELKLLPVDLSGLVEEVAAITRVEAEAKGLAMTVQSTGDIADAYLIDDLRLQQILINLLSNAVRFTERGSIDLCVDASPLDPFTDRITVRVRDTGVGVSIAQQKELFSVFSQADASITRIHGGAGLGLALSKSLVDLMDGQIDMSSGPSGSEFRVRIDLRKAEAQSPEDSHGQSEAQRALRVLVVDDHPVNREIASLILQSAGCNVETRDDGAGGVKAATAGAFDIILMDIRMPGMDGFSATRAIRALPGEAGRVPILAVTADVAANGMERCIAAGMNGCIAKPISQEGLIAAMSEVLWPPEPDEKAAVSAA